MTANSPSRPSKRLSTGTTKPSLNLVSGSTEDPVPASSSHRVTATARTRSATSHLGSVRQQTTPTPTEPSSRSSSKHSKTRAKDRTESLEGYQHHTEGQDPAAEHLVDNEVDAPRTPASTHMDSEDDINSVASSGDFNLEDEDQNSDISIDDGESLYLQSM